jgi:hypothetical protein
LILRTNRTSPYDGAVSVDVERPEAKVSWKPRRPLTLAGVWAIAAVLLPTALIQGKIGSIDLAYHLRAGDLMLRTHHLLRTDPFAFTVAGLPWTDQQWGAQIILGGVFRAFGWGGLALLQTITAVAIFFFVYRACRARGAAPRMAAWVTLGAALVASFGLTLRPQLIAALLFSASLWLIAERRVHPRRLWVVPVLVAVWANIHGTFFLGSLLLLLAALEDRLDRNPLAKRTFLIALVALAATLVNPFGPGVWGYLISLSTNSNITDAISEWQAASFRNPSDVVFFASVVIVFVLLMRRGRQISWSTVLTVVVFFIVGVTARRSEMWWALAVAPALAGSMVGPSRRRAEVRELPSVNVVIAAVIVMAVFVTFPWSLIGADRTYPGSRVFLSLPGITSTLEREARPGDRIFNSQKFGSWLEFAVSTNPVFIDSVIEVYPDRIWRQYHDISNGREGWDDLLRRWDVRFLVLDPTRAESLIPLVRKSPDWRLVHQDHDGLVFASISAAGSSSG